MAINNTDAADINEIQMGFFLAGGWRNFVKPQEAKKQLADKLKKVGQEAFDSQTEKAQAMADEVINWATQNGYSGGIKKVWWTARPGILANAVGADVDSRKNPTDILVQFGDKQFLGLSAKSTKGQTDIGFKNPGVGTIESSLKIKLKAPADKAIDTLLKEYPLLSPAASTRKKEIRKDKNIATRAEELGTVVLNEIRDTLHNKLSKMTQKDLIQYILDDWMDAKGAYPRYIKVTGMRVGAKIEDPLKNNKIAALSSSKVTLTKVGNDSVGIMAGGKRIMKMRAKYESQKLASTIKFSGDPWK